MCHLLLARGSEARQIRGPYQTMLPDYPLSFWLLAPVAVTLAGVSKAGFGGGVGTIATPLMALAVPVVDAAAIMLPLLLVSDFLSVYHYRKRFHRPSVRLLLSGALVGIAAGGYFFSYFSGNEPVLKFVVGAMAVLFVGFQMVRAAVFGILVRRHPPAVAGVIMGAASGFMSTLVHAGGPPVAIYLLPKQLPRDLFVGTTVIFFATVNLLKLIPYAGLGLLHAGQLVTILLLAPMSFCGVRLGLWLNARFSEKWFNLAVYVILMLTGLQLMIGKSLLHLLVL